MKTKIKEYFENNSGLLKQNKIKEFLEFVYKDSSLHPEEQTEIFTFINDTLQYFAQPNSYNFENIPTVHETEFDPPGVFNFSKIVYIGDETRKIKENQFFDCAQLKSVIFPESVEVIDYCAFARCTSIESIVFPNSLKEIGSDAFGECNSLQSVIIPDSVEEIGGGAFISCKKLQHVKISDSVNSIGEMAFADCRSLMTINLPKNLEYLDDHIFDRCDSLFEIKIPKSLNPELYKNKLPENVELKFI